MVCRWMIFVVCLMCSSCPAFGQEKIREVHLNSNRSILYKQQFKGSENRLWSAGLSNLTFDLSKLSSNTTVSQFGAGAMVGLEFRSPLTEFVSFYHGPSVFAFGQRFNSVSSNNSGFTSTGFGLGMMYNAGLLFKINDNFLLTTQIAPSFSYSSVSSTLGPSNTQYNLSLQNFPLSAGFVFRF